MNCSYSGLKTVAIWLRPTSWVLKLCSKIQDKIVSWRTSTDINLDFSRQKVPCNARIPHSAAWRRDTYNSCLLIIKSLTIGDKFVEELTAPPESLIDTWLINTKVSNRFIGEWLGYAAIMPAARIVNESIKAFSEWAECKHIVDTCSAFLTTVESKLFLCSVTALAWEKEAIDKTEYCLNWWFSELHHRRPYFHIFSRRPTHSRLLAFHQSLNNEWSHIRNTIVCCALDYAKLEAELLRLIVEPAHNRYSQHADKELPKMKILDAEAQISSGNVGFWKSCRHILQP